VILRRVIPLIWPLVSLAVVGYLDYMTGPLLPFFPVYLFVLVAVSLRRSLVVAVGFGALAAAILCGVDLLSVPALRTSIYPYWRGIGHLMSFGLVTFTIPRLIEEHRRLAESEHQLMRQRREINELNTALVQALEDHTAERERAIDALISEHTVEIRSLREVVRELRATGREPLDDTQGARPPRFSS
jgi:hypothetical protein